MSSRESSAGGNGRCEKTDFHDLFQKLKQSQVEKVKESEDPIEDPVPIPDPVPQTKHEVKSTSRTKIMYSLDDLNYMQNVVPIEIQEQIAKSLPKQHFWRIGRKRVLSSTGYRNENDLTRYPGLNSPTKNVINSFPNFFTTSHVTESAEAELEKLGINVVESPTSRFSTFFWLNESLSSTTNVKADRSVDPKTPLLNEIVESNVGANHRRMSLPIEQNQMPNVLNIPIDPTVQHPFMPAYQPTYQYGPVPLNHISQNLIPSQFPHITLSPPLLYPEGTAVYPNHIPNHNYFEQLNTLRIPSNAAYYRGFESQQYSEPETMKNTERKLEKSGTAPKVGNHGPSYNLFTDRQKATSNPKSRMPLQSIHLNSLDEVTKKQGPANKN